MMQLLIVPAMKQAIDFIKDNDYTIYSSGSPCVCEKNDTIW